MASAQAESPPPLWPIRRHPPESILKLFPVCFVVCRLREERGDAERALALDQKPRDLSSHNGKINTRTLVYRNYSNRPIIRRITPSRIMGRAPLRGR